MSMYECDKCGGIPGITPCCTDRQLQPAVAQPPGDAREAGRSEAFSAYLKDCDDLKVSPSPTGAFSWAWQAATAQASEPSAVHIPAKPASEADMQVYRSIANNYRRSVNKPKPVAFEFQNSETGHCIVDYSEHTYVGHLSDEKGYTAKPLIYADTLTVDCCAECGKTSTKDSMWALYCLDCVETKLAPVFNADAAPARAVEPMTPVVAEILAEVERATQKFPTWPTDPLHALAVLGEEFGELTKDALQLTYEPHKTNAANVRKEAMQTAAMALRWAMSLERYEYTPCAQHSQQDGATTPAAKAGKDGDHE